MDAFDKWHLYNEEEEKRSLQKPFEIFIISLINHVYQFAAVLSCLQRDVMNDQDQGSAVCHTSRLLGTEKPTEFVRWQELTQRAV